MDEYTLIGLMPIDRLLDDTRMLDTYFWTVMGLAAIIVTTLFLLTTRQSVIPIGKLIHYIATHYTEDGNHNIEQIQRSVERIVEERRQKEEQLKSYEDERQQFLLRSILVGGDLMQTISKTWDGMDYTVACFHIADEADEVADSRLKELVDEAAKALISKDVAYQVVTIRPYAVMLLFGHGLSMQVAVSFIEQCLNRIDERSRHMPIAAISGLHIGSDALEAAYMPYFISTVVICGMLKSFLAYDGLISEIVKIFGGKPQSYLSIPSYFPSILVFSELWQGVGWGSIIYMAALAGIDMEQYEAACIDGCGRIRQMIHVTLPGLVPTMTILLILDIGSIMSVASDKILLLYTPLTYETGDVIGTYVYRKGIRGGDYSSSTAIGLFETVVSFLLLVVANTVSKKVSENSLW